MRHVDSIHRRSLLLALAGLPLTAPAAAAFTLEDLFALMQGQRRISTTFTETKSIHGLDAPIESSGELGFEAPSRMTRRTLHPRTETLTLDGDAATVERAGQQRTVSLDEHPEIAVHVEALRACLSGDLAALRRVYRATLAGSAANWHMTLVPLDEQAAAQVRTIELTGQQADIRVVEIRLANGDRSVTRIAQPRVER